MLDAVEDFCNGPGFLFEPDGEKIMQEHSRKNESRLSASAFPSVYVDYESIYKKSSTPLSGKEMKIYIKTCNGQTLSKPPLKNTTAVIAYDWFDDPAKQYLAKEILAVNPFDQTAVLRQRNKKRFKALVARHNRILKYYYSHKNEIEKRYAESAKILKTEAFWKKYLKIEDKTTQ